MTGLAQVPKGIDSDQLVEFEQYQRHTVWDKPGGLANRSGAGDLDVVIYTARKWCRLALAGNPPVLLALFVPDGEVVHRDESASSSSTMRTDSSQSWPPIASSAICSHNVPR